MNEKFLSTNSLWDFEGGLDTLGLNPTEFAQNIDLLINVPDVAPSTVEKMRSLQMCPIKKITPLSL